MEFDKSVEPEYLLQVLHCWKQKKVMVILDACVFTKEEKNHENGLCILDFSLQVLFLIHTSRI